MKNHMDYHRQREHARGFVHSRLEVFNEHYCFVYNRVAIRNQRTRWGKLLQEGESQLQLSHRESPLFLPITSSSTSSVTWKSSITRKNFGAWLPGRFRIIARGEWSFERSILGSGRESGIL